MAESPSPGGNGRGDLIVVATARPLLAEALATALGSAGRSATTLGSNIPPRALVLAEPGVLDGRVRDSLGPRLVCLGGEDPHLCSPDASHLPGDAGMGAVVDLIDRLCEQLGLGASPLGSALGSLTPREKAVLAALQAGLRPQAIADRDFVSVTTVRNQVQAILTKLNVHSRLEAVALASAWAPPNDASAS